MNIGLALLAAFSMFIQDSVGVIEVQAEALNHGWIAGFCNAGKWVVAITCTTISVSVLKGHNFSQQVLVVSLVMVANVLGSKAGQIIGQRYFNRLAHERHSKGRERVHR